MEPKVISREAEEGGVWSSPTMPGGLQQVMDPVHREVLTIHHTRLVTALRANDVIGHLLQDGAISKYDYDQLKRTEAQGARAMNRLLVLTLRRRGGASYPALQRALRASQQRELADTLHLCELDLLEGLVTQRLHDTAKACAAYPAPKENRVDGSTPDSCQPEPSTPILQKASSPALKKNPTPRATPKPHPTSQSSTPRATPKPQPSSQSPTPRTKDNSSSPSPSSKDPESEKEGQLKQMEKDIAELRKSHKKMETDLRKQIQQLEKEAGQKKGGGCVVM